MNLNCNAAPAKHVFFPAIFVLCVVSFILSCSSIPKTLPEDTTAADLLVQALDLYDSGKYKAAEYYCNAAIARSTNDVQQLIPAEYELAHMYIKRKKWAEAKPIFERIVSYYQSPESYAYPQEYKKLSELELAKIPVTQSSSELPQTE